MNLLDLDLGVAPGTTNLLLLKCSLLGEDSLILQNSQQTNGAVQVKISYLFKDGAVLLTMEMLI